MRRSINKRDVNGVRRSSYHWVMAFFGIMQFFVFIILQILCVFFTLLAGYVSKLGCTHGFRCN